MVVLSIGYVLHFYEGRSCFHGEHPLLIGRSVASMHCNWIGKRCECSNVPSQNVHVCTNDPSTIDCSVATEWWRMQKSSLNSDFRGISLRPGVSLALRFAPT